MRFLRLCLLSSLGLIPAIQLGAAQIHVAPTGDDRAPGTANRPVATLSRARELLRNTSAVTGDAREVVLHDGRWQIAEPLMFDAGDSHVTWKALHPGRAVISGGVDLQGWTSIADGLWSVAVPAAVRAKGIVRELFVNRERRTRARTPNAGFFRIDRAAEDRRSGFTFNAGEVANVPDLGQVELVFLHDWSITRVGIARVNEPARRLETRNPIGANASHYAIDWFEPHPRYLLENSRTYLDQPGEWCFNSVSGDLLYRPLPGETPDNVEAIVPLAAGLIEVRGSPEHPVRDLHFAGIRFEHCNWQTPANGYAEGQANYHEPRTAESGILREIVPAAIHLELARGCSLRNVTVRHLGGGGISFGSRTVECILADSEVVDVSGNGVLIGEDTGRRVNGQPWWQVAPAEVATGNRVVNCRIHECGRQFFGAVGIWVGLTDGTSIENNEIFNLPYTGVSLGWIWNPTPSPNANNLVAGNHIHHVLQTLSDGGGIYTLGRQPGTILRGNLIHDVPVNLGRAESNGMFLDEGTTDILIERNTIHGIDRSPLRFHRAGENIVRDNILVVRGDTPPVRYNNTPEANIRQEGNLIAREVERQP